MQNLGRNGEARETKKLPLGAIGWRWRLYLPVKSSWNPEKKKLKDLLAAENPKIEA